MRTTEIIFNDKSEEVEGELVTGNISIYLAYASPEVAEFARKSIQLLCDTLNNMPMGARQTLLDIKEHCEEAAGTEDAKYINKAFDRICDAVGVSNHWLD